MASRPAKRQRRSTIVNSDDSETGSEYSTHDRNAIDVAPVGLRRIDTVSSNQSVPAKRKLQRAAVSASPKSSPEKARKPLGKIEVKNKSLHSFFGRATEEQRWKRRSDTPPVQTEDTIEDDIVDDVFDYDNSQASSTNGLVTSNSVSSFSGLSKAQHEIPTASQKFARAVKPNRSFTTESTAAESYNDLAEEKPWADRYGPETLEELAVHKKKVADVQMWLKNVMEGRERKRLLILKGPAGSGKTSTISLLCRMNGIITTPWHNATVSDAGVASNIQQFAEYLQQSGQFEALSFLSEASTSDYGTKDHRRVLLVEEFPTISSRTSSALSTFRSVLIQFLSSGAGEMSAGRHVSASRPPLVMVISETLLSSSTALSDSFTAHRLLGPDILSHPLTTVLEFNPVAPTFVQKALDLVIKKEARDSKRRRMPGPAVIQRLAEIGDVRSAINSLEFFCARGDNASDWSGTVAGRPKKAGNVPLTETEKNTLKLVSNRESTLDMFHAAGKIVYNKREDSRVLDTRTEPPPKPPDHLLYLYNSKVSQVDIEALFNETGTDIQTFIATLHENYVLSCNGDDFVESFGSCANILSDSDILNPETRVTARGKGNANVASQYIQGGNFDMLRQDEISFQVASRGLLFCLPYPVQRAVPMGVRKQDAFKMFYPNSLRLWKPTEEIYDLMSMFVNADLNGISPASVDSSREQAVGGVSSWRSRGFGNNIATKNMISKGQEGENEGTMSRPVRAMIAKDTYILDILPYMTQIKGASRRQQGQEVKTLRKITQFHGINLNYSGDEPDDTEDSTESFTDQTINAESRIIGKPAASESLRMSFGQKIQAAHDSIQHHQQHQSRQATVSKSSGGSGTNSFVSRTKSSNPNVSNLDIPQTPTIEKLYISDDDIQDD